MALTKFPSGISSFGVPQLGGTSIPSTTGKYFFVDSVTGSNGNTGLSSDRAVATVDYAVGLCTANKGDIIIVMPGHNEAIVNATDFVVDVAGVSIIGLGVGQSRPVFDFDNTAASMEFDAANCRMSNVVLNASVSAVVVGVNVDANGCEFDNIETTFEATGDDFVLTFDVDTVDRTIIRNCALVGETAVAGVNAPIRFNAAHYTVIRDNYITGEMNMGLLGITGASSAMVIMDNVIYNSDTSDGNGIEIDVACTGLLVRNFIGTLHTTQAANLDPGSLLCFDNKTTDTVDLSGTFIPITTAS